MAIVSWTIAGMREVPPEPVAWGEILPDNNKEEGDGTTE